MQLHAKKAAASKQKTPCLIVGVLEGRLNTPFLKELDRLLDGALTRAGREGEFSGEAGQLLLVHSAAKLPAQRLLLIGLGKLKGFSDERLRLGAGHAIGALKERKIGSFVLDLASFNPKNQSPEPLARVLAEGLLLADYRFERYLSEEKNRKPPVREGLFLTTKAADVAAADKGLEQAAAVVQGVCLARNLVNEPGNVKSPEFLASQARELAAAVGLNCTILEREALEREGFGALLGVAQGSCREPRLIVLEYRGGNADAKPIALVGKGVVFDAGGISLKPAEKMDEMKMDMAGGAAVLGALKAAALLKLPVNLVGIVPAVENLPSGTAYRPGDILTSLSGKTIEVLNTDAEGRLILADALTYAARYQPRVVIDLATLTGACIIALGHHAAAVLGKHDGLVRQLIRAGEKSGERLWQLPLWEDYAAQLKSPVADMKNIGGRPAGTITAAAFLHKFAAEYTWAHLDIAGTAWEEKGNAYTPKGGTGFGVRLLVEYLRQGS